MVNYYRELWNQARRLYPSRTWYQTYVAVNRQLGIESLPESDTLGWRKDLWRKTGVGGRGGYAPAEVVEEPASGGILDVLDDIAAAPARERFPNDIYGDVGYRPLPSGGVNPAADVEAVGPEPEWLVEEEEFMPRWTEVDPMDPAYPYLQSDPADFFSDLDRINAPPAGSVGLSGYLPEASLENAMTAARGAAVAYYLYEAYKRKVPEHDTGHPYTDPWISHALAYRPEVGGVVSSLAPDFGSYGLIRAGIAADDALQADTADWQKRTGVDLRSMPSLIDSLGNKILGRRFYHPAEQGLKIGDTITTASRVYVPPKSVTFWDKLDDVSYYFGLPGKLYRGAHAGWRLTHGEFARGVGELTELVAPEFGVPEKLGGIVREGTKEGIEWVYDRTHSVNAPSVVAAPAVHDSPVANAFQSLQRQLYNAVVQQPQQGTVLDYPQRHYVHPAITTVEEANRQFLEAHPKFTFEPTTDPMVRIGDTRDEYGNIIPGDAGDANRHFEQGWDGVDMTPWKYVLDPSSHTGPIYTAGPTQYPVPQGTQTTSTLAYPGRFHIGAGRFAADPYAMMVRPPELDTYVARGGNKWLASLMHPNMPSRMPKPDGGYGTGLITQKLWVELTADANGDVRFMVTPYTKFMYVSVAPATGVQTVTPVPDESVISAKIERMRLVHLSVLITYHGNPDDSAGIMSVQSTLADNSIATWNEDADALSRRMHTHTTKVYEGAYAYAVSDPNVANEFNADLFTAANTAAAGVATSGNGWIKVAISGATASVNIARAEIIGSWEFYSEDQLWTMVREANHTQVYEDAYYLMDKLNIPRMFNNDLHNEIIKYILKEALKYSIPAGKMLWTMFGPAGMWWKGYKGMAMDLQEGMRKAKRTKRRR